MGDGTPPLEITSPSTATIHGTLTVNWLEPGDLVRVECQYGEGTSLNQSTTAQVLGGSGAVDFYLIGLDPSKEYSYQVVASKDQTLAAGAIHKFTTNIITTDYFSLMAFQDGSITFLNVNTGAEILRTSPRFSMNYGEVSSRPLEPLNYSFENDTGGVPDDWTVNRNYIATSTIRATDGAKSLRFNMAIPDPIQHRNVISSVIAVDEAKFYDLSFDAFWASCVTFNGYYTAYLRLFTTPGGTGSYTSLVLQYGYGFRGLGVWTHFSLENWQPPAGVRSIQFQIYIDHNLVGDLFLDNVRIAEKTDIDQVNGLCPMTITQVGDDIAIDGVDDSNRDVRVTNHYDLNLHSSAVRFNADIEYKNPVVIKEERFDFIVPALPSSIMTRDLNLIAPDPSKTYISDSLTPGVIKFGNGLAFLGNDNAQSSRLTMLAGISTWSLFRDWFHNHPYSHYIKGGGGASEDWSRDPRAAGETSTLSVTFYIDPAGPVPASLVKMRTPGGTKAALVLTTHADSEYLTRIRAIAYGSEDVADPNYGLIGIVSRGVGWAKATFVSGSTTGGDLSNPAFKTLIDQIALAGVEIIGHTITPVLDDRATVQAGMTTLDAYGARNWIDHDVLDNYEDLAAQGSTPGDANYVLDLMNAHGYKFAWAYQDLSSLRADNINMLDPSDTDGFSPILYQNRNLLDPVSGFIPWLWATLNTQKKPETYYTNANIDALVAQRGIHLAHDYYGVDIAVNHCWYTNPVTHKIEIFPAFDATLAYIQAQVAAGLLWTGTMATYADFLILLANVTIEPQTGGTFKVKNNNAVPITGLTLLAEDGTMTTMTLLAGEEVIL